MRLDFLRRLFPDSGHVVGINRRNVELVYAHNPRTCYRFADDKLLTKELLGAAGVPVPETYVVCDGLDQVEGALASLAARSGFVVKPASSSGGQGILVVGESAPNGWRRASGAELTRTALRQHMANIIYGAFSDDKGDRAYVEARVRGHAVIEELWAEGLSDVRVITLGARPVIAMLRVPTRKSQGRANLHQGALGLAVDLGTGKVVRALHQGSAITLHPDSNKPLLDIVVPSWSDVLEVARLAARSVPLGYLGVDIVIDHSGAPMVLEVNARPGLEIQNVHARGIGEALARLQATEGAS